MEIKILQKRIETRYNKRISLFYNKSLDYSNLEDCLSNFRRIGKVIEVMRIRELPAPLSYCFTMIILKLDRWINLLLKNSTPENESVEDTICDLQNYVDLTEATFFDLQKKDYKRGMEER